MSSLVQQLEAQECQQLQGITVSMLLWSCPPPTGCQSCSRSSTEGSEGCFVSQGLWKGVLPSLIMVANPTVNYMLYEALTNRLLEWKRKAPGAVACDLEETPNSQHKVTVRGHHKQHMLYEALTNRLLEWKRKAPGAGASGLKETNDSQHKIL